MGIRGWETVKSLGGTGDTIAADDIFTVVDVHWKRVADEQGQNEYEPTAIADNHHTLVDDDNQEFEPETGLHEYVARDDRFQNEVLTTEHLQVGEEFVRTLVFDVPPNRTYTLKAQLESLEEPETFYMELGTVDNPA